MADIYNIATQAYQQGRQRAQDKRLNELAQLAMRNPSALPELGAQMAGIDASAGLQLSGAIQERQLAEAERNRTRAIGLARFLRQIPQASREQVASAYRKRAPDLPQTLDDSSLDAYMAMGQAQSMTGAPASLVEFNAMTAGLTPEERARAQRVALGIEGRAPSAGFQWREVQIGDRKVLLRNNPMSGATEYADIATGSPMIMDAAGNPFTFNFQGVDQAERAQIQPQLEQQIGRQLTPSEVAQVFGGGQPQGIGTNTVDLAARTAAAQEQARIAAELAAAPDRARAAGLAEREKATGRAAGEREASLPGLRRAANRSIADASRKIGMINTLIESEIAPNISGWTTGTFAGWLSGIGGTKAADLQASLGTLRAYGAFSELQAMRDASPTGSALGSVTERELSLLEQAFADLEQSRSPESFRRALQRYELQVQMSWENTLNAYEDQFGERPNIQAPGGASPPAAPAGFKLIRATPVGGN